MGCFVMCTTSYAIRTPGCTLTTLPLVYRSSLPALLAPRWTSWLRRTAWTGSTRCDGRCQAVFAQGADDNLIIDMLPQTRKRSNTTSVHNRRKQSTRRRTSRSSCMTRAMVRRSSFRSASADRCVLAKPLSSVICGQMHTACFLQCLIQTALRFAGRQQEGGHYNQHSNQFFQGRFCC